MVYIANIPQPADNLDDSQGQLLGNFQQLNTSFGIDHYPFTDVSANLGTHNQVTTPLIVGSAHPATAAGQVKLYNMSDLAAIGNLQYSRGPSSAVPSPVTTVQSAAVAFVLGNGASVNVIDFDTLGDGAYGTIIIEALKNVGPTADSFSVQYFYYQAALGTLTVTALPMSDIVHARASGKILQVFNSATTAINYKVRWTVQFYRIQN